MKKILLSTAAVAMAFAITACGAEDAQVSEGAAVAADAGATDASDVETAVKGPIYKDENGVAVSGYDATSYFEGEGVPVKGSADHSVEYAGAIYHFASAENASKFEAAPASFAPQYGGHCAWAMSQGKLAPGDAMVYKVVDGKLYLNLNKEVQKRWFEDIPGFIAKADETWPTIPEDATIG